MTPAGYTGGIFHPLNPGCPRLFEQFIEPSFIVLMCVDEHEHVLRVGYNLK